MSLTKNHGITLIEVIVILVLIGIISLIIVSHTTHSNTDLIAQTEVIKVHLRYAQSRAMNSNVTWYIQFTSNTYSLYKNGILKYLPGEDNTTVTLPTGMSITCPGSDIVSFNSWGKPCTDAAGQTLQTTTPRTLTVSAGLDNRLIVITKNTGFIQ